jgi:hypothetical protein
LASMIEAEPLARLIACWLPAASARGGTASGAASMVGTRVGQHTRSLALARPPEAIAAVAVATPAAMNDRRLTRKTEVESLMMTTPSAPMLAAPD